MEQNGYRCRNSNGNCSNCTGTYCSNFLRRPPCYDPELLAAGIAKLRGRPVQKVETARLVKSGTR